MDLLTCIEWLNSAKTADLYKIAEGSGVPFHTLRKIARGETANPGVFTMQKVVDWFAKQPKRAGQTAPIASSDA